MDIGTKIRFKREDADITQKQIADMIPMNQSNYSKIERNLQDPSMEQLKRIAEILKLDLNDLFGLNDNSQLNAKDMAFVKKIKEIYLEFYGEEVTGN